MNKYICFVAVMIISLKLSVFAFGSCEPVVHSFTGGQHIDVGNVVIWNDSVNLYVRYDTNDGWKLNKTHINVSTSLDDVPVNNAGVLMIGHFMTQTDHDSIDSFLYSFALSDFDGDDLYILTHAEVVPSETNTDSSSTGETAFGGDIPKDFGSRWAFYSEYSVCDAGIDEVSTITISGTMFFDENKDALFNSENGELSFYDSNVKVQLWNSDGTELIAETYLDSNGNYFFDNVVSGEGVDYIVQLDPDGVLDGLVSSTSELLGVNSNNGDAVNINFGYELPVIGGTVSFDIIENGLQDVDEPGIEGLIVNLYDENSETGLNELIATTTTDVNGYYEFEVYPGNYIVEIEGADGLVNTTELAAGSEVGFGDEVVNTSFAINFDSICGQLANGFTIGFWKNNIRKAIDGKTKGVQIDAATIELYLNGVNSFALEPFSNMTKDDAVNILSSTGSNEIDLLKKQLLGSEFNYFNNAFIGNNEMLTELFIYYGEYVVKHFNDFTREEMLNLKDWFDAYNNSYYRKTCLENKNQLQSPSLRR